MTPLEINNRILGLKGCMPHLNKCTYPRHDLWPDAKKHTAFLIGCENWAEDIKDAWELFEEMRIDNVQLCAEPNQWTVVWDDIEYCADTAPMAICLAWIKWKEANGT